VKCACEVEIKTRRSGKSRRDYLCVEKEFPKARESFLRQHDVDSLITLCRGRLTDLGKQATRQDFHLLHMLRRSLFFETFDHSHQLYLHPSSEVRMRQTTWRSTRSRGPSNAVMTSQGISHGMRERFKY
jgi:hypothetical protein